MGSLQVALEVGICGSVGKILAFLKALHLSLLLMWCGEGMGCVFQQEASGIMNMEVKKKLCGIFPSSRRNPE